mgnify:CR=1 FL=1
MNWESFIELYVQQLRMPLFSGLFSVAGFLFAMETFIIVKMKEGLYDSDEYQCLIKKKRKRDPKHSFYGGLRRLSRLLTGAVIVAILASISQIIFGFYEVLWSILIAVGMGVFALATLVTAIVFSSINLHVWFVQLERIAVKKANEDSKIENGDAPELDEK